MKLKEAHPKELSDRSDRASAKLARIARVDVQITGGAKALRLAHRMKYKRIDAHRIVGDAYTSNTGNAHEFLAYHCPECNTVVLGITNAKNHCNEQIED